MTTDRRTKKELLAALDAAETRAATAEARVESAEQEAQEATNRAEYLEQITTHGADTPAGESFDEVPEGTPITMTEQAQPQLSPSDDDWEDPDVLYDPFEAQNPHKILAHPAGFRLAWINPEYRDRHRTWRGWKPIEHDDEIGRNLDRYLLDPPRRMEHQVDNYVRRGDTVLARLAEGIWLRRMQVNQQKIDRYERGANLDPETEMGREAIRHRRDMGAYPVAEKTVRGRTMTS